MLHVVPRHELLLAWDDDGTRVITVTDGSALHVLSRLGGGAYAKQEVDADARAELAGARAGAKALDSGVRAVAWGPCELSGGLIAAACGDGRVCVWEQRLGEWWRAAPLRVAAAAAAGARAPAGVPLSAIAFAPPHVGLQVAVGGEDGLVRVFACEDPAEPTRDGAWALRDEMEAGGAWGNRMGGGGGGGGSGDSCPSSSGAPDASQSTAGTASASRIC